MHRHLSGWSGPLVGIILALGALPGGAAPQIPPVADPLASTLRLAGERVEAFFNRAQSLICTEKVSIQPLDWGLTSTGFPRRVESELRLSWDPDEDGGPATEAQVRRKLLRVNGHPPRDNDHNNCTTPEQQESETQPLSMLLAPQRAKYTFELAGPGRVDGRDAVMIDFRELAEASPEVRAVEGKDDCISYELNGGGRGRLWIDAETFDVLRLDQRLVGMVDLRLPRALARRPGVDPVMTLERSDTTTRFGRVAFKDPDESLVLPLSSTELRVMRGGGAPRLRTVTTYADYKRFLTGGRVVGGAGAAPAH